MGSDKKYCTKCKETKDVSMFGKDKRAKDGLTYVCSMCKRKYEIELRERHLNEAEKIRKSMWWGV